MQPKRITKNFWNTLFSFSNLENGLCPCPKSYILFYCCILEAQLFNKIKKIG